MAELKTYKQKVRYILENFENARNNDGSLFAYYIYIFHKSLVVRDADDKPAIRLSDLKNLPPIENIRRSRQIIQNNNQEFIPTDIEVREARKIKERNWTECEIREASRS